MIREKLGLKTQALEAYKQGLGLNAGRVRGEVADRLKAAIERISQQTGNN